MSTTREHYLNPYVSGVLLGVVLFLSFLFTGHGLGASGGLARMVTFGMKTTSPVLVNTTGFFASLGGGDKTILSHWLVWEIVGVLLGGLISGLLAKRVRVETFHGPQITRRQRWLFAFLGGLLVGFATQLSRGCTSGQALSGGAILSAGSWAFMFSVFAGAYLVAFPFRRLWR